MSRETPQTHRPTKEELAKLDHDQQQAQHHPHRAPVGHKQGIGAKTFIVTLVIVGLVSFVLGTRNSSALNAVSSLWGQKPANDAPATIDLSSVQDVYSLLRTNYDGKLDTQKLIDGAKKGLVEASGDQYSQYFTNAEAEEFLGDLEGDFSGIGAELGQRNNLLTIISTLDGSPARTSGLQARDIIVSVNGESSADWSVEQAVSKIRGQKGTTVKLVVSRGSEPPREFVITRDTISDPSVKSEITADNVAIMRVTRFSQFETTQLATRYAEEYKAAGVKGVVLDLRNNGGGYAEAARQLASLWLEDKVAYTTRRGGQVVDTKKTDNNAPLKGIPTVVLVNGGSASASEILAGALHDNKVATLVGEKTYGKGSVQSIEDVVSGGKLKVTIEKWYTPAGKNITEEGIEPEQTVGLTADDVNADRDPQRDAAIKAVLGGR